MTDENYIDPLPELGLELVTVPTVPELPANFEVISGPTLVEVAAAATAAGLLVTGQDGYLVVQVHRKSEKDPRFVFLSWPRTNRMLARAVIIYELGLDGSHGPLVGVDASETISASRLLDRGLPPVPKELEPLISTATALLLDRLELEGSAPQNETGLESDTLSGEYAMVAALLAEPLILPMADLLSRDAH